MEAIDFVLVAVVLVSAVTDLFKGKIYNMVTLPALIIGLLLQFRLHGAGGLYQGLFGCLLAILIGVIPFIFGGFGAGDVKCLMVIGACKGPWFFVHVLAIACLIGVVMGLVKLGQAQGFRQSISHVVGQTYKFIYTALHPVLVTEEMVVKEGKINRVPFGVPIAFATLLMVVI